MDSNSKLYIGLDIGGTNTEMGLINTNDFVNVFNPQARLFSAGLTAAGNFLFAPFKEIHN